MCPDNAENVFDSHPPGDNRSIKMLFIDVMLLVLDCWHLSVCLSFLLIALRPQLQTGVCMTDSCNVYYFSHTIVKRQVCIAVIAVGVFMNKILS